MRRTPTLDAFAARLALAAGGGALYFGSLPPWGAWWLAWIALTPLCLACAGLRPIAGALLGGVFGLVAAIGSSPWFPLMIGTYFAQPGPLGWGLALAGWIFGGAIYLAMLGAWLSWAAQSGPVSPIGVGAVFWSMEWLRAHGIVANPWALLGYSQMGFLPIAQLADLVGPYGIGAGLAAFGAAVAGLIRPNAYGRSRYRNGVTLLFLVLSSLAYGAIRLVPQDPEGEPMRSALVQGAPPERRRSDPTDADANLDRHLRLTEQVVRAGSVDLVLWPELALDFYIEAEPERRRRLVEVVGALDVELITGGLGMDPEAGRPTNSAFLVDGRGLRARYDKVRLMDFSEANPLPFDLLGPDAMSAGQRVRLLRAGGAVFGLAICSEAMHPGYAREVVRAGANVLLVPSIDRWFASFGGRRQQLDAVSMRAIETRRFVLRPTADGITAVIDPQGRVLAEAPVGVPATLEAWFMPREDITFYVRFGDVGVVAAALWIAVDARRRRRRRARASMDGLASSAHLDASRPVERRA